MDDRPSILPDTAGHTPPHVAAQALSSAPFAALIFAPDARFTLQWRNAAHAQMTHTPDLEIAGRGMFEAFPPNDAEGGDAARQAIKDAVTKILDTRETVRTGPHRYDLTTDGTTYEERHWTIEMSPVFDQQDVVAILQVARDVTHDVLSNTMASALQKMAMETGAVSYFRFDPETGHFQRNEDVDRMFGFEPGEIGEEAGPFFDRVHEDDLPGVHEEVARIFAADRGEVAAFDYRVHHPDGRLRFVRVRGQVVTDPKDRREKLVGSFVDISDIQEQRQALAHEVQMKQALVDEANHRIKNSLMLSLGLLRIEKRALDRQERLEAADVERVLSSIANRIEAVSAVHGLMQMTASELNVSFRDLVSQLVTYSCNSAGIPAEDLECDLGDHGIRINSNAAITLGLILNEIITNALKYGYDREAPKPIRVVLRCTDDTVHLTVSNSHIAREQVSSIPSSGMGGQLVKQMAETVEATVSVDTTDDYVVTLSFPLRYDRRDS